MPIFLGYTSKTCDKIATRRKHYCLKHIRRHVVNRREAQKMWTAAVQNERANESWRLKVMNKEALLLTNTSLIIMITSYSRIQQHFPESFGSPTQQNKDVNRVMFGQFWKFFFQIENMKNIDENSREILRSVKVHSCSQHFLRLPHTPAHFLLELISLLTPLFLRKSKTQPHQQDLLLIFQAKVNQITEIINKNTHSSFNVCRRLIVGTRKHRYNTQHNTFNLKKHHNLTMVTLLLVLD